MRKKGASEWSHHNTNLVTTWVIGWFNHFNCVTFMKLNPIVCTMYVYVSVYERRTMYSLWLWGYKVVFHTVNKLYNMVDMWTTCKDSKSINTIIEAGDMIKLMGIRLIEIACYCNWNFVQTPHSATYIHCQYAKY